MAEKSRTKAILRGALSAGLALSVAGLLTYATPALTHEGNHELHETHAHDLSDVWSVDRGGQLYDKWWSVLMKGGPKETHPAYPAGGKKTGADTWRCKECHGWDYKGATGAYGKGSHYTGIKGVRAMAGVDPKKIHEIIMDDTHRYTEQIMPHEAMEKLALFVSRGQIDMDRYIERDTKKSKGDPKRGAGMFQTICAVCHGFDGKAMNFKSAGDPEYIGTIANENPWEFLHKARFGQPGVGMISLITLPPEALADILAYAQMLPEK